MTELPVHSLTCLLTSGLRLDVKRRAPDAASDEWRIQTAELNSALSVCFRVRGFIGM